jgi:hypothetical protein
LVFDKYRLTEIDVPCVVLQMIVWAFPVPRATALRLGAGADDAGADGAEPQ